MQSVGFSNINFKSKKTVAKAGIDWSKKGLKETYNAYNLCRAEEQAYYNLLNNADHPSIHLSKETRDYIYKTTGEYLVDIRVPNLVHNDIIHRVTTDALKRKINKLEQQLATESLSELERKDMIRAIQVLKAQQQRSITPEYFKELVNSLLETWTQITAKK